MTTKFRKKPVVVHAIQYIAPSYGNITEFIEKFGDNPKEILVKVYDDPDEGNNVSNMSGTSSLAIRTLEGDMKISNGDWIIRGIKGEYYPCKNDIFMNSYDSV
jgi:hypothetical protein